MSIQRYTSPCPHCRHIGDHGEFDLFRCSNTAGNHLNVRGADTVVVCSGGASQVWSNSPARVRRIKTKPVSEDNSLGNRAMIALQKAEYLHKGLKWEEPSAKPDLGDALDRLTENGQG